jgi:hypothetical protein
VKTALVSGRSWIGAAFLSAAFVATALSPASAITITFDDLPAPAVGGSVIPNGYSGLTWTNFSYVAGSSFTPSGLLNGTVSAPNVAFNKNGGVASVSSSTPFNFTSLELTSAWDDGLFVSIVGSINGQAVDSLGVLHSTLAPTLIVLNWTGLTEISFTSFCLPGLCTSAGYPGTPAGTARLAFVLDDLVIVPATAAPLPAALSLFAGGLGLIGCAGAGASRRRRKL